MIFCAYCDHPFHDGETLTIRLDYETERPYHSECFAKWYVTEQQARELVGEKFSAEWFRRPFFERQIQHAKSS